MLSLLLLFTSDDLACERRGDAGEGDMVRLIKLVCGGGWVNRTW